MSNTLALATVTATLKEVLRRALARAEDQIPGGTNVEVTTVRPNQGGIGMPAKGVNIFLYQVTPNAAWRNADLPARRGEGGMIRKPQAALDAHYLFSFHGEESKWEAQRILGIVEQTLHAWPTLSRDAIRSAVASIGANSDFSFLLKSDLAESPELVRLRPMSLSLEEMSKIWSVFLQTTYHLSAVWQASVVLIEAAETSEPARAVKEVSFKVGPMSLPALDLVTHPDGLAVPVTFPGDIALVGRELRGDLTHVLIDGIQVPSAPTQLTDVRIVLQLPAGVQAGVRGAQVSHAVQLGIPPTPHRGPESNVAPFVLHPRISGAVATSDIVPSPGGISAVVRVPIAPNVGRRQRAVIQLNTLPDAATMRAYSFTAPPRPSPPPEADASIAFKVTGVAPGTYAVHVLVDGALDAPLSADNRVTLP